MKLSINCLLAALLAMTQLSRGYARSFPPKEETQVQPESTQSQSAATALTIGTTLKSSIERGSVPSPGGGGGGAAPSTTAKGESARNSTAVGELRTTNGGAVGGAATDPVGRHIIRKKRDVFELDAPYDLHTTHMFCDFDERGRHRIVMFFPNHCIWVWNNKYVHEGFYHLFKLYQTEGFFFGQYNERLKQYETVAHVWTAD